MAVNPLSLAESLRPWRAAGITHFLGSAPVWGDTSSSLLFAPVEYQKSTPPPQKVAPFSSDPKQGLYPGADAGPTSQPAAGPESWPAAWQSLFSRTKPAPILWTYPELGGDLGGRGCAQRSACLRDLIGKVQLPRGSSTFWPLCLDAAANGDQGQTRAQEEAEAGLFKEGLLLLAPKVVVLIGPRSAPLAGLADLGLDLHTPFTQQIVRGMLFVLLPEFPALLENLSLSDKACLFLRSALAKISV